MVSSMCYLWISFQDREGILQRVPYKKTYHQALQLRAVAGPPPIRAEREPLASQEQKAGQFWVTPHSPLHLHPLNSSLPVGPEVGLEY